MKRPFSFSFLPRLGGRRASFKIGVIATLAIAVGANIAVLGNLGVLFGQVVPGAAHDNLLAISYESSSLPAGNVLGVSRRVYDRFVKGLDDGAEAGAYKVEGGTSPTGLHYLEATPSLTGVLGVHPIAGRLLVENDTKSGAAKVALISEAIARTRFGSPEGAINQGIELEKTQYRVVGVLPAGLAFPSDNPAEAWIPLPQPVATQGNVGELLTAYLSGPHVLVHPAPGVSTAHVKAIMVRAQKQYMQQLPSGTALVVKKMTESMGFQVEVESLAQRLYGLIITQLELLELAALLLFLLVLANLAGLATADTLARRHEFAAKAALGASTSRLYVERVRELIWLGLIGWAAGIGLGWLGSRTLSATIGQAGASMTLTWPVLLLTLAAVVIVMLLLAAGGILRLHAPRHLLADLMGGSRTTGGKRITRTLRALIVLQLSVSVILLIVAAHFRANVASLSGSGLGFDPAQLSFVHLSTAKNGQQVSEREVSVSVSPGVVSPKSVPTESTEPVKKKSANIPAYEILTRLKSAPGVKSAAALMTVPLSGSNMNLLKMQAAVGGTMAETEPVKTIIMQPVSSGIVETLGLRVLAGDPQAVFSPGSHDTFVDARTAHEFFPKSSPTEVVGKTLHLGGPAGSDYTIAAVVANLKIKPYAPGAGQVFKPIKLDSLPITPVFAVRSGLHGRALRTLVNHIVKEAYPTAKVTSVVSASALIAKAFAKRIRLGRVFGVLAVVALLIAAVGLFALLAYRTLVRRPEFAIRGALGATPGRLLGNVLGEATGLWLIGCLIGVPAAYGLSVVLTSYLPKLGLPAIWVTVAVIVAMGIAALIAALVPARRAAGTDLSGNLSA